MPGSIPDTADYMISANTPINAFEVIAPNGASLTVTYSPSGWICLDPTPTIVKCAGPMTPANTILTGSFSYPADISIPSLQAAGSLDGGNSFGPTVTLSLSH